MAKLKNPLKASIDKTQTDLKEIYSALGKYQKALDKVSMPASYLGRKES